MYSHKACTLTEHLVDLDPYVVIGIFHDSYISEDLGLLFLLLIFAYKWAPQETNGTVSHDSVNLTPSESSGNGVPHIPSERRSF